MSSEPSGSHGLPPGYQISTDPARLDLEVVHRYLGEESYWARGISRDMIERMVSGSLCFGLYAPDGAQVGFARAITDRATFAWLADVFVATTEQGRGLGKALIAEVVAHPDLRDIRRIMLVTRDAHGLYTQFGFAPPARSDLLMERLDPAARERLLAFPAVPVLP